MRLNVCCCKSVNLNRYATNFSVVEKLGYIFTFLFTNLSLLLCGFLTLIISLFQKTKWISFTTLLLSIFIRILRFVRLLRFRNLQKVYIFNIPVLKLLLNVDWWFLCSLGLVKSSCSSFSQPLLVRFFENRLIIPFIVWLFFLLHFFLSSFWSLILLSVKILSCLN